MDINACKESNDLIHNVFTTYYYLITIPGFFILLVSTLFAAFHLKKDLTSVIKKVFFVITIITSISVLYIEINYFLSFFKISGFLPLLSEVSIYIIGIVFPLSFVFYLAWKNTIPLHIHYLIIVSYFIVSFPIYTFAGIWIYEQVIFTGRICLGLSCPVRCDLLQGVNMR